MNKKGFTITELIAVIVVLSLLIVIAVPVYNGVTKSIKEKTLENKKNSLEVAAVKFANENHLNEATKITATRLVLENYYKAESYEDNNRELPYISNPANPNDNLACHTINITIENYDYKAEVNDESNCEVSLNEIDENKINVYAYELDTRQSIEVINKKQTKWTNKNVLLQISPTVEYDGIEYTIFGSTTSKTTGTKNCNSSGNINSCMNLYKVEANLYLNQEISITLKKNNGNDITKRFTVKIDKEKPVVKEDSNYNAVIGKKDAAAIASDGIGSGIEKVYYSRKDLYASGEKEEATLEENANQSVRAILDKNMRKDTYYVWAIDKVGNESERFEMEVKDIAEQVRVRYNGNGGTASKAEDIIERGGTLTNIATATRTNYNFDGWWTDATGGTQVTSTTPINGDITLFAHWGQSNSCEYSFYSSNYKWIGTYECDGTNAVLTTCTNKEKGYECNGGSGNYSNTYPCTGSKLTYFNGYETCNTSFKNTLQYKGGDMDTTESCSCKKVSINYNINGGFWSGDPASTVQINSGSAIGNDNLPKSSIALHNTKILEGWYKDNKRVYYYTRLVAGDNEDSSNVTLKAKWRYPKINYSEDGGTGTCEYPDDSTEQGSIQQLLGSKLESLCTPTREGYAFLGWYTEENGNGTKITNNTKMTRELDGTYIHAYWQKDTVKINISYENCWPQYYPVDNGTGEYDLDFLDCLTYMGYYNRTSKYNTYVERKIGDKLFTTSYCNYHTMASEWNMNEYISHSGRGYTCDNLRFYQSINETGLITDSTVVTADMDEMTIYGYCPWSC